MGCMCMECKFATVLEDNREKLFSVCVHRESENFLKELEIAFDNCEFGVIDDYGEEQERGAGE